MDATFDQITSLDKTYVATILFTATDYLEQAKCLNEEELQMLKSPDTMSELQKSGCGCMINMDICLQ